MKIEIQISDDRTSYDISVDGSTPVMVENFVLLTKEGEMTRNLVFGDSGTLGRLLFGLYANCSRFDHREMRNILEQVAESIRQAREAREGSTPEENRRLS